MLGSVVCKERCGSSVTVTLVRLAEEYNEEKVRKTLSLADDSNQFLFEGILPGKYRLEVQHFCSHFFTMFELNYDTFVAMLL